jgi:tRNA threonylcarbamoyladenosine modification (KEOPS) complex  Pcc1 subunit
MVTKTYSFSFSSPASAHAAQSALSLETGQSYEKRARSQVRVKNNRLVFTSIGQDMGSLRASISGYTKLAEFLKKIEKGE